MRGKAILVLPRTMKGFIMTKNITEKKRLLIFINIVISCIASSMLQTALTTAVPPIVEDLNISITTGQWLTSGYSLVMAITMPLTAFLINRFPTKKLYCSAIMIFIAGILMCIIAKSFLAMMIGRVIQAIGNGMMTAMSQVIVLTIFPPEKRGMAMGWYGLSVGAAPIIAPTIAGVLVDTLGWRMIFGAAFMIMAVSLVYALLVFADVLENVKKKFDVISFVMSALAFGGITLGIGNISSYGVSSFYVLPVLAVGIIASVMFVCRQLRLEEAFLELRILKDRNYAVSVLGSMLLYFVMMGSTIIIPLYVQQTMGLSATISGLVSLPGSLVMAVISPFAGKIYDKVGIKVLFLTGSICLVISNFLMFFIRLETTVWIAAGLNIIRNAAIGCLMMPLMTWGAGKVDCKLTPHATALVTSLRTIAGAIGSAVFVGIMTAVTNSSFVAYGDNAAIHGVNITFLAMAGTSLLLVILAIVSKNDKPASKTPLKQ